MVLAEVAWALVLCVCSPVFSRVPLSLGHVQDPAPEEKEVRRRIDVRIEEFRKSGRRLGPGLLRETIADTLAFGVPTYNSGDRDTCARFYMKSAESLLAAFPAGRPRTPLGDRSLAALQAALGRAAAAKDSDGQAWAMRFGFDRVMIEWEGAAGRARALVALGSQNFGGGRYSEAAQAFRDAADLLEDVIGQELGQADLGLRGASFMCGHACLADGRWAEAARALAAGYVMVPEFPKGAFDLRSQFRADRFEEILSRLKAAALAAPGDADLAFLLGYVYFHSGRKAEGRSYFEKSLRLSPGNAGARAYLPEGSAPKKSQDF